MRALTWVVVLFLAAMSCRGSSASVGQTPDGGSLPGASPPGNVGEVVSNGPPPGGTSIVFVSRAIQPDGSFYWNQAKDMPGVGAHSRARPSPPGRLLLLGPDGQTRTLVDGANPTDASFQLVDVNAPAVSYDGKTIAFAGLPRRANGEPWPTPQGGSSNGGPTANPGAWRLFLIDADGQNLRPVPIPDEVRDTEFQRRLGPAAAGLTGYDDYDPCWLPDDEHLVFSSTRYPSYGHYSGARASQLFIVKQDGTGLYRVTSERNSADRPTLDPLSGRIVYARWWRNFHFPTDDPSEAGPVGQNETGTPPIYWRNDVLNLDYAPTEKLYSRKDGVTADRYADVNNDTMFRNAWQAAEIRPDGTGLAMFTGFYRAEPSNHFYGGAFADDGTLFGNFFPMFNMTEAAGFGGIRRLQRGPNPYQVLVGAGELETDNDQLVTLNGANGNPSYGIYKSLYAGEPEVLPDASGLRNGRVLFSRTQDVADIGQDYGLWVMNADGSEQTLLYDVTGYAELRARVVAPRMKPPMLPLLPEADHPSRLPPRPTTDTTDDPHALASASRLNGEPGSINADGTFRFIALNVYANAPVDVPIVSAIPVGTAHSLRGYANYQRHSPGSFPTIDWPLLLEEQPISPQGFAELTPPAHVPLFEQVRDAAGNIAKTDGKYQPLTDATAHVAGLNFGTKGSEAKCLGCHAGHSMMPLPPGATLAEQKEAASWTNLAPGATVTVSSDDSNGSRKQALVDRLARRIDNLFYAWKSAQGSPRNGVKLTLTFPVAIQVRRVVLWNQVQNAQSSVQVNQATVRLFSDPAATSQVGSPLSVGSLATTGTPVEAGDASGVRAVEVTLDNVSGKFLGYDVASLAEIEVIGRAE